MFFEFIDGFSYYNKYLYNLCLATRKPRLEKKQKQNKASTVASDSKIPFALWNITGATIV